MGSHIQGGTRQTTPSLQCISSHVKSGSYFSAGPYWTIDSRNLAQNWTLDATGNWSSVTTDGDEQARGHNAANEIESADGWATPAHDAAGNMIFAPQPGDLAAGYHLK